MKIANILLILATMSFIIIIGGAVYEHLAVVPSWSAAPPSSLAIFHLEYPLTAQYFWMGVHPVTILLLIGALITNWHTLRRINILTSLIGYAIILVITSIYFVPELMDFMGTPASDSVDQSMVSRASMWEILSLVRLGFLLIIGYLLLSALTKSGEAIVLKKAIAVPLSYENDALGG